MKLSSALHCCTFKRFKSSSLYDNGGEHVEAIIRTKRESKLLYGKLLESSISKQRKLKKLMSKDEQISPDGTEFLAEKKVKKVRKSTQSDTTRHCHCNASVDELLDTDIVGSSVAENSLLSFPFLNPKRQKYVVKGDAEEERIKKLYNHHPDYPSVSEILNKSMSLQSEANLERWKVNMVSKLGTEEFKSFNNNQMAQGSLFRTKILHYLNGVPEEKIKINDELKGYWSSAKAAFPMMQNIVDTRGLVAHPYLKYKGLFDCLSVFRNEVVLVSWKKSEKYVPSLERTYDTPLQIAAYIGALNFDDRYPFRVEQALLIMAYNDGSRADIFHLNEAKCKFYWEQWLNRLSTYFERIREKDERKNDVVTKIQVSEGKETTSKKIDIDNELKKISVENRFSPRIIKESEEVHSEINDFISSYSLINSEKPDYDPTSQLRIQSSIEYENRAYTSVSTILSETKSEAAKYILEKWKREMIEKLGREGFEKYEKETLETGSALHELLNIRFTKGLGNVPEIPKNIEGFWKSLSDVFPLVTNVQVTESKVAHPICKYRGIIDCVGFFQDKLMVIDWKTSEKMKTSISMTYDAPLQIAAYIGALNFDPSYPFKVEEGLIVVAYNNGTKANVFHLNKEKCLKYWKKWLERVNKYQSIAYENGSKIQY